MNLDFNVKGIILYFSTWLSFLFGEFDKFLQVLIILMIIDYITGILAGFYFKELSSKKSFKGIIKKFFLLTIVSLSQMMDEILCGNGLIRSTILLFFISTEGLSILENSIKVGVPVPKWLTEKLEQIRNDSENKNINIKK